MLQVFILTHEGYEADCRIIKKYEAKPLMKKLAGEFDVVERSPDASGHDTLWLYLKPSSKWSKYL